MDFTLFEKYIKDFLFFSEFTEGKSQNTIKSLKKDLEQLKEYLMQEKDLETVQKISPIMIRGFLLTMQKNQMSKRSLEQKDVICEKFFQIS